jgi:energy-coupling factor transporter ATP-binding protein EcfA2
MHLLDAARHTFKHDASAAIFEMLEEVRAGKFNLLLGPSGAGPSEIASIAAKLGPGEIQLLVKNYINENG